MATKEEFIEIFKRHITRPGADALLDYLENDTGATIDPSKLRDVLPKA